MFLNTFDTKIITICIFKSINIFQKMVLTTTLMGLAMVFKEDDKPLIRGLVGQEGLFDEIKPWEDIVNRDVSNFCNQLNARSNSKEIEI